MSHTDLELGAEASIWARVGWIFTCGSKSGVYAFVARMTTPARHSR